MNTGIHVVADAHIQPKLSAQRLSQLSELERDPLYQAVLAGRATFTPDPLDRHYDGVSLRRILRNIVTFGGDTDLEAEAFTEKQRWAAATWHREQAFRLENK